MNSVNVQELVQLIGEKEVVIFKLEQENNALKMQLQQKTSNQKKVKLLLQISKTLDTGIILENAYVKITYIAGNEDNINLTVSYFANKESYLEKKNPVLIENYDFRPNIENTAGHFIYQGYEHLKTLSQFTGAIDTL